MYISNFLPIVGSIVGVLTFVFGDNVQDGEYEKREIDCESDSLPAYPIYTPVKPSNGSTSVLPTSAQDPISTISSAPLLPTSALNATSMPAYTPIITSSGGGVGTNTLPNSSSTSGAPFTNSSLSAAPTTAATSGTGSSMPLVTYTFVNSATTSRPASGSGISTGSSLPIVTSSGIFTNSSASSVAGTTSASAIGNTSSSSSLSSGNSSGTSTSYWNSPPWAYTTGPISSSASAGTGSLNYSTSRAPFPANSTASASGSGGTGTTIPLTTSTNLLTTTATATLTLTTGRVCQLDNCLLPLQPTDSAARSSASALCSGFSNGQIFQAPTIFPRECNLNRVFSACSCLDGGLIPSSVVLGTASQLPTALISSSSSSAGGPPVSNSSSAGARAITDNLAAMTSFQTMTLTGRLPPPPPLSSASPVPSEELPYSLPMSLSETRTWTRDPEDPESTSSFGSLIEEFQRLEDLFLEIIEEQSELAAEALQDLEALGAQLAGQGRNNGSK